MDLASLDVRLGNGRRHLSDALPSLPIAVTGVVTLGLILKLV